jgi:hypothetical protein
MAHKTFISYKYSEARGLRDEIIKSLGSDATYYQGETSDSPDLTDTSTENIKRVLKDQIWGTSVTIVVVSPNMTASDWIDWEIEYSLKAISRGELTSHSNGVVGVIMKYNGDYSWLRTVSLQSDGCYSSSFDSSRLYSIINNNRFNQDPKVYNCERCNTVSEMTGCYFSLITEEDFLNNPKYYVDNAYDKSQKTWNYNISKQR